MSDFDPKLLRKVAATYRARAASEDPNAETFLQIAAEMEAHAGHLEAR